MCLAEEDLHPVLFWNNPNIHPFMEYKARLEGLHAFSEREHIPLVVAGEYGLRDFVRATSDQPNERCQFCYETRLEAAAAFAAAHGFDAFSTTLFVSPYQNHELIAEIGRRQGAKYGVPFLVRDFRRHFRDGQQKAREMNIYMQKYCGCIFSEEDRYEGKKQKLKRGFFPHFAQPGTE